MVYLKVDIEAADAEYDAALENDKPSGKREGDGPNLLALHEVSMFMIPFDTTSSDTQSGDHPVPEAAEDSASSYAEGTFLSPPVPTCTCQRY